MVCLFYLHVSQQSRLRPVHSVKCKGSNFVTALRVSILGIQYCDLPHDFLNWVPIWLCGHRKSEICAHPSLQGRIQCDEIWAETSKHNDMSDLLCIQEFPYFIKLAPPDSPLKWKASFFLSPFDKCLWGWVTLLHPRWQLGFICYGRGRGGPTRPNSSVTRPFLSH